MNTSTKNQRLKELLKLKEIDLCQNILFEASEDDLSDALFLQLANEIERLRGDSDKALAYAQLLQKKFPNRPIGHAKVAQDLLALGYLEKSIRTIEEIIKTHPENQLLLQVAADAYRESGDLLKALEYSRALIEVSPNRLIGFHYTSKNLLKLNQLTECIHATRAGLDMHQGDLYLLQLGIEAARAKKDIDQVLDLSNQLKLFHPDDPSGFTCSAQSHLHNQNFNQALQSINEGLARHPNNLLLLQIGIEASRSNENFKLAIEFGKKIISLQPNEYHGYINTSRDLAEIGNLRDAEKIIAKPQHIHPNAIEPIYHAREFYRSIGNRKKSLNLSTKICFRSGKTDTNLLEEASDLIALGRLKDSRITKLPSTICERTKIERAIRFLHNEEAYDVIPSDTRATLSALQVYSHFNKDFNPININSESLKDQITICVIHIGKCAGESILNTLQKSINNKQVRIIEFHIFDANMVLQTFFDSTLQRKDIHWMILTRDPLIRWISSFNWDQHIFSINNHLYCHAHFKHLMQKYKNAKKLIRDLIRDKKTAFELSSFNHLACGHMRMGQAWYLERFPLDQLATSDASIIRTEHINHDYEQFIHNLENRFPSLEINKNIGISRTKSNYKNRYSHDKFTTINDLDQDDINFMKSFLGKDYIYHNEIVRKYLAITS